MSFAWAKPYEPKSGFMRWLDLNGFLQAAD